jgi:RsiW-degrading membrane proteinase PrsW (M82 family)
LFFTLRWLVFALVPAGLFGVLLWRIDRRRDPAAWLVATFVLGAVTAMLATLVTTRAAALTALDLNVSAAGPSGALVFVFFVLAPVHEVATVAAVWPAFLSKHLEGATGGLVYTCAASLGFSVVETAFVLRAHPDGAVWIARALLAVPANVFLACLWGYALGRAKRARRGPPIFPLAFLLAVGVHGLYEYLVFGRGPGALLAVLPILAAMGLVAWLVGRDLPSRGLPSSLVPSNRLSRLRRPPSMSAVRAALRRADQPIRVGWIVLGALVNLGAMISGIAAGVFAAHALHVDLSTVDEQDVGAAAPALLLAVGLLASFPASGWLIARAASVHSLLEPALATVLALTITLVTLGFVAPFTVVFALALSPIAWVLACAGAWVGLEA